MYIVLLTITQLYLLLLHLLRGIRYASGTAYPAWSCSKDNNIYHDIYQILGIADMIALAC